MRNYVAVAGLIDQLPKCADVRNANSRMDAQEKAGATRGEADNAISRVHEEVSELSNE
jgi:hypothetical protein